MRNFRHLTIDVGRNPHADGVRWYGNNSSILKDVRVIGAARSASMPASSVRTGRAWCRTRWSKAHLRPASAVRGVGDKPFRGSPCAAQNRKACRLTPPPLASRTWCREHAGRAAQRIPNDWKWWGAWSPWRMDVSRAATEAARHHKQQRSLRSRRAGGGIQAGSAQHESRGQRGGGTLGEYLSHPAKKLFPDASGTALKLPVKSEPQVPWETNVANWVCANEHGAKFGDNRDDTAAVQAAIDAAAAAARRWSICAASAGAIRTGTP